MCSLIESDLIKKSFAGLYIYCEPFKKLGYKVASYLLDAGKTRYANEFIITEQEQEVIFCRHLLGIVLPFPFPVDKKQSPHWSTGFDRCGDFLLSAEPHGFLQDVIAVFRQPGPRDPLATQLPRD